MAPKKRTASSRKTSQSNQPSQPAKFGIQHFFERHLSQTSGLTQNPKPNSTSDTQSSPSSKSELSSADQVPPPVESKVDDCFSEISPEASKRAPPKRFKFSPSMLIQQSQDDGGDAVTWKVSPVNERLRSLASKHLPRTTRVFAEASGICGSILQPCSETESPSTFTMSKLKSWLSSKPDQENGDGLKESQSPFRTPPSLPYSSIALKADLNGGAGLVEHQKDLMTLLDQVKDAIVEEEEEEMEASDTMTYSLNHDFVQEKTKNESTNCLNGLSKQESSAALSCETYLVLEVSEKHKGEESSCGGHPFKILRLLNEQRGTEQALYLYDEWFYSLVAPGDTVNVIGEFNDKGKCIVDRTKNLVIVHPDVLISGTRVASSFTCSRRAVLDERLKISECSISALIGTLLHQVFQEGLITRFPSRHFLEEHAKQILQKNLESLYACGANEKDILSSLIEVIPQMLTWFTSFMKESENSSIDFGQFEEPKIVSVNETIDIEEMAWAPRYGLKGMIDASLNVRIQSSNGAAHERILPLEFKTGKATTGRSAAEHAAQVMLYTLLMSERYLKNNVDMGLIYYLRTNQTIGIKVQRSDLVGLVMRRNELASEILKASTMQSFPPMLQSPTICTGCRHLNACGIYHKANGGSLASSGLGDIFDNLVNHLTPAHCNFLNHWERLIDLEAQMTQVTKKEIWRPSLRQEKSAGSISSLVLDTRSDFLVESSGKSDRYIYQFARKKLELDSDDSSILDFSFRRGDCVVLSTESGRIAVATGVIKDISHLHVSISLSRRLRLPGSDLSQERELLGQEMWRIDKDEFASSYGIMRLNLVQLFFQNSRSLHLRKLIVDLQAPRFESGGLLSQNSAISYVRSETSLNDDQRRSIHRILAAKDYALILGMPGTGKTHTMAHAVKALLIRGASVLLTSYTNSAIDNLLLKLKSENIDFIRIGRIEAVHHEIREHCFSGTNAQSLNEIKQRMETVQVVGVTCLAINHPLLSNKKFDFCIMDEAGQITLPVSLGPLMLASKFVLVGDHYQLPPLVQSTEARENGMGISLFWRLSEAHPNAICALQCQYRMCTGIMELSNSLIYGNRLRCGSSQVALAKLHFSIKRSKHPWLNQVLDPEWPAIFVNTDELPALEERENKAVHNPAEAHIVSQAVTDLINRGIKEEEVGVITPYNSQASLIRQLLGSSVEVHTIDRYQGRDKDCVVVSFVRSNTGDSRANSSLLGDWHRINVVLTRAKKKLIMVGSQKTLSSVPLLKLLIEKVDALGGVVHVTKKDICCLKMPKKCSQTDAC